MKTDIVIHAAAGLPSVSPQAGSLSEREVVSIDLKTKKVLSFVVTALALVVLFLFAVNTGSLKVTPGELFRGLFVAYDKNVATIYDLRFPRIFIALLGGAATAVSGVLLQAVMKIRWPTRASSA